MGIGVVLVFWTVMGIIVAGLTILTIVPAVWLLTRGVKKDRWKVLLATTLFPFVCLAWGGVIIVFQAIVNDSLLERDCGLGDTWRCPLPSGYGILLIDRTDQGSICNKKTQAADGIGDGPREAIIGVRDMQIAGRYIFASADGSATNSDLKKSELVDRFFMLDTQTGKQTEFANCEELTLAADKLGVKLDLRPIYSVYQQYRGTWLDQLSCLLLFMPPLIVFGLLVGWVLRLRSTRDIAEDSAGGVSQSKI